MAAAVVQSAMPSIGQSGGGRNGDPCCTKSRAALPRPIWPAPSRTFALPAGLDPLGDAAHRAHSLTRRVRFRKGDVLFSRRRRVPCALRDTYGFHADRALLARDGAGPGRWLPHRQARSSAWTASGAGTHDCRATALEDMETCPLPFGQIEDIARGQRHDSGTTCSSCCRTRARAHSHDDDRAGKNDTPSSGSPCSCSTCRSGTATHGYSSCEFVLRMTRERSAATWAQAGNREPPVLALSS